MSFGLTESEGFGSRSKFSTSGLEIFVLFSLLATATVGS